MQSANFSQAGLNMDFSDAPKVATDSNVSLTPSRSTSAGSSRSRGQSSVDQLAVQKPSQDFQLRGSCAPFYPSSATGLPEYDYPAPQFHGSNYPEALIVKNTFLGTQVLRTPSLEEFFEERQTQSCPSSGIGLPPGLEDLVEPEEAAARLFAAEVALRRTADIAETNCIPTGLLDLDEPCSRTSEMPYFYSDFEQQQAAAWQFNEHQQQATAWHINEQPQQPAVVLDLMQALSAADHTQQPQFMVPPQECPTYVAQNSEPELGSPECPTVGSQGHHFGNCKPCAFLYTKGCSNGVMCSFCHICDAGEKKKRAKESRNARRNGFRC